MRPLSINQPAQLVIQPGALKVLAADLERSEASRLFILTDPFLADQVRDTFQALSSGSVEVAVTSGAEPSFKDFEVLIQKSRDFGAEGVVGIGGGSVLDLAKLVAALTDRDEALADFVGNGLIKTRKLPLYCVPSTSGAGSESSPNAILIDHENAKKGIIDSALMPDAVYIDPELIASLPPDVTAYTGLDALTHCIEAFANKFAHPVVDVYALEGIRLISQNLGKAIENGQDLDARMHVALGAYYGGMCLGPVNTAAVHALAYPLGIAYKVAHGLSNALLLPHVLEFNLSVASERYAAIGLAMGSQKLKAPEETALQGIGLIRELIAECGMPSRLSELNVKENALEEMAEDAMQIQRLLKNNVREVSLADAVSIYKKAY